MEKLLLTVKNKNAQCFYQPFISDLADEKAIVENYRRLFIIQPDKVGAYVHTQLYCVGIFDDVSGDIKPDCHYIVDFDDIISQIQKALGADDGKED